MEGDFIVYRFQFHKVRLKEKQSIEKVFSFKMFQFHKVRLKDVIHLTAFFRIAFQFHKVRLKGCIHE